jgi:hypothetical protein
MYNLMDFLGLSGSAERKFRRAMERFEAKIPHKESLSARTTAEIYENSHRILRELDFQNSDVLAQEAYAALRNKFLGDWVLAEKDIFWKKYEAALVVCEDGLVSVNFEDIAQDLAENTSFGNRSLEHARAKIKDKIAKEYSKKLSKKFD